MRGLCLAVCVVALVGCFGSGATGRLPAHLVRNTAGAITGHPVLLRSRDGSQFAETEVSVEMEAVPGPVRAHRNTACPNREGGARFARLEVDGADAFKIYVGQSLRACAIVARPNGERLRVEEALNPDALPGPIVQAVQGVFQGDYTVAEAWRIHNDGADEVVELVVRKAGREFVLITTPSGAVRERLRRLPATLDLPDR